MSTSTMPAATLAAELESCARFAGATEDGKFVMLAGFTRNRITSALRHAASLIREVTDSPARALVAAERAAMLADPPASIHELSRDRELMEAAECYLLVATFGADAWHNPDGSYTPPGGWPFAEGDWDPSDNRTENLARTIALLQDALALRLEQESTPKTTTRPHTKEGAFG